MMNTRHMVADTDFGPDTLVATGDAVTGTDSCPIMNRSPIPRWMGRTSMSASAAQTSEQLTSRMRRAR
jgi:hypothetical protein